MALTTQPPTTSEASAAQLEAAFERGRDVFAEPDDERLRLRVKALTSDELSGTEVRRMVAGDLRVLPQLAPESRRAVLALVKPEHVGELERIVGDSIDYVPIVFVERARAAASAVARVADVDRQAIGTGVMVSPSLFLTNNHVTESPEQARHQIIQFDFEVGPDGRLRETTDFALDPDAFWYTSDDKELDFTIVAVGRRVAGGADLESFGSCPLSAAGNKHAEGDFVTVVQHPSGDDKQIALRENRVVGRGAGGVTLHYGADTLPGSSGSPVFNDQLELIALHHAGGPLLDHELETGRAVPNESNEGIRASVITQRLREVLDQLDPGRRTLLAAALDQPYLGPSLLHHAPEGNADGRTDIDLTGRGGHAVPADGALAGRGWVRAALPLDVAVRLRGADTIVAADLPPSGSVVADGAAVERNQAPDPAYARRRGYDEDFIGFDVPLPRLSNAQRLDTAVLAEGEIELRYLHFSVVQNARRRMPFFTAVNIDGRRSHDINRTTGEVEASERWYGDPRIGSDEQLDQSVFDRQRPRIFDRGHLVRRIDPAWGAVSTARRASDDTFHFTNCCPQVSRFNQSSALWQGIEGYVLDNARAERARINVFSGPVFGDDDPEYRGVGVPRAFWKLLVRSESGALRATAFLASQNDLLDAALAAPERFEDFVDLGRVEMFQVHVLRLEAETGLDFGSLAAHDTLGTEGLERMESHVVRDLADVSW
jgi:endonuclease G